MNYPTRCAGCLMIGSCREEDIPVCESQEAIALGDMEAELAAERYWEDRGWEEQMLQDEMEARAGVIPFSEALAEALGE